MRTENQCQDRRDQTRRSIASSMQLPLASLLLLASLVDAGRHPLSNPWGKNHHQHAGFMYNAPSRSSTSALQRCTTSKPTHSCHSSLGSLTPRYRRLSLSLRSTATDGESSIVEPESAAVHHVEIVEEVSITQSTTEEDKKEQEDVRLATPSTPDDTDGVEHDDAYYDQLFDTLAKGKSEMKTNDDDSEGSEEGNEEETLSLVDFIEESVGIRFPNKEGKNRRGKAKTKEKGVVTKGSVEGYLQTLNVVKGGVKREDADREGKEGSVSTDETADTDSPPAEAKSLDYTASNEFTMASEIAHPPAHKSKSTTLDVTTTPSLSTVTAVMEEQPPPSVREKKEAPYNVVCTHITADFDTLASAIGLAKMWSLGLYDEDFDEEQKENVVNGPLPTYVVLPRGAHPDVKRFLSLHKHLFPIRELKSLPGFSDNDLKKGKKDDNNNNPNEGLQRVGLVDAQRRDRLGPAEILLPHAKLGVTIVDHHMDAESDIAEARNFVCENVGSVSTMIADRVKRKGMELTEAEATILALGIHSDTGSLVYDSTTPKDAAMLGWVMEMGASQAAIAEHAKPTLSDEQQGVLTQALVNLNSTSVHGVTIATVLLSADGFIPGLATVTKDALDLSSSDIFLLAVCYEATRGTKGGGSGGGGNGKKKKNNKQQKSNNNNNDKLQRTKRKTVKALAGRDPELGGLKEVPQLLPGIGGGLGSGADMISSDSWKGGEVAFQRQRLAATFAFYDADRSGFLEKDEIYQALGSAGFVISKDNFDSLIGSIDRNGDGKIDFEEFVHFYTDMEEQRKWDAMRADIEGRLPGVPSTMTIIGRVKAGVNVRNVNLNQLFQQFNGGGHPKAASATAKLEDESEAERVLQGLVDELVQSSLEQQLTVGDFMQSPVLSAKPTMTEKQVEDLFVRYDVRALPVVDDENQVIGLVSYKEVAAAKVRLMNKQEKRIRQIEKAAEQGKPLPEARPLESALKGWMKQHVQTVPASFTMAEVEQILLENDVGCIPVVVDDTKILVGMVTRTDLLRQHRYYSTLHYHNKGFSDSIAARKPMIELRKKLKKFDVENE